MSTEWSKARHLLWYEFRSASAHRMMAIAGAGWRWWVWGFAVCVVIRLAQRFLLLVDAAWCFAYLLIDIQMSFTLPSGAIVVVIVIDGLQCLIDGARLCHLMWRWLSDVRWLADNGWIVMIFLRLASNNPAWVTMKSRWRGGRARKSKRCFGQLIRASPKGKDDVERKNISMCLDR